MFAYALMIGVVSTLGISTVMSVFLKLPFSTAILLSGGLVVAYSTIGGMWALTLTDMVQFVIKTIGLLLLLLPISLHRAGGWDELVAKLPAERVRSHDDWQRHHHHVRADLHVRCADRTGHLAASFHGSQRQDREVRRHRRWRCIAFSTVSRAR